MHNLVHEDSSTEVAHKSSTEVEPNIDFSTLAQVKDRLIQARSRLNAILHN